MGPDKLKVLKEFDLFAVFQSITRAIQIRALWDQFNELYHLIQDKKTTGEFFRYKAKSWLDEFQLLPQDIQIEIILLEACIVFRI